MTGGRPKRSSALKAASAVRSLNQLAEDGKDLISEKVSPRKKKQEEEEEEAGVFSLSECSETESLSSQSPSGSESALSSESDGSLSKVLIPSKRGRKPKNADGTGYTHQSYKKIVDGKTVYLKLTEFKSYGPGPHSLSKWQEARAKARPIRRGKKSKKGVDRLQRPPTELLILSTLSSIPRLPEALLTLTQQQSLLLTPFSPEPQPQLSSFAVNNKKVQLTGSESKVVDHCAVLNLGVGPLYALDWCRCCGSRLAVSALPSPEYKDYLMEKKSADTHILIIRFSPENGLTPELRLEHNFGIARHLNWYPHRVESGSILAATFNDQTLRIFYIPHLEDAPRSLNLNSMAHITIENTSCFSWSNQEPNILFVGSFDGRFGVFDLSEAQPRKIFSSQICSKPLMTISQNPEDKNLLAIGSYEQHFFVFNLASPHEQSRYYSSINAIPNVLWVPQGIIYWEQESSCRLISYSSVESPHQTVIVNFASAITGFAQSQMHNVLAASSAEGSVHFLILQESPTGPFSIERSLLSSSLQGEERQFVIKVAEVLKTNNFGLHPRSMSVTSMAWSGSEDAPGVLAIGMGGSHLLVLPLDRYLLAS